MKKNFVLVVALTIALGASAPASAAYTRDGGHDRGFNPIDRIVRIIKKLFTPTLHDEIGQPHP